MFSRRSTSFCRHKTFQEREKSLIYNLSKSRTEKEENWRIWWLKEGNYSDSDKGRGLIGDLAIAHRYFLQDFFFEVCFVLVCFFFSDDYPALKRACRKRDQNYSFPAKLLFALLWTPCVPCWHKLFLLTYTYLSEKACHVNKSFEGENSHSLGILDFHEIGPERALIVCWQNLLF